MSVPVRMLGVLKWRITIQLWKVGIHLLEYRNPADFCTRMTTNCVSKWKGKETFCIWSIVWKFVTVDDGRIRWGIKFGAILLCLHLIHRTCFVRQPFPCSFMFDNNCCLCYMHRSKSFAIIIRPHPNGLSHSRSVRIHPRDLVRQNPVLQIPGFEVFWSFKFQVLQIQSPR